MFKGIMGSTISHAARILALGMVGMLAACGGGGGGDGDSSIALTLEASPINPGESTLLFWDATFYDSCALVGSPGLGAKVVPKTSGAEGFSTGVIKDPGTYTFTLSCTGALAGQGTGTAVLTVSGPANASRDCGVGLPTQALLSTDGATVTLNTAINPADLCVGCSVTGLQNIITKEPAKDLVETYATLKTPLSFNKATEITVSGSGSFPVGRPAGFLISTGTQALLSGDARRSLTVQTLLNGTVVQTYTTNQTSFLGYTTQPNAVIGGEPFTIDIFGKTFSSVPNGTVTFIGFTATQAYNGVRIGSATKLSANDLRIYAACVGAP